MTAALSHSSSTIQNKRYVVSCVRALEQMIVSVQKNPIEIDQVIEYVSGLLQDQRLKPFWPKIGSDLLIRLRVLQSRTYTANDILLDCNGILNRIRYIFYSSLQMETHRFNPNTSAKINTSTHLHDERSFRALLTNRNLDVLENIITASGTTSLLTYLIQKPQHNPRVIEIAVRAGATINDDGSKVSALPPLHSCIEQNTLDLLTIVELLLRNGANPNLHDDRIAFRKYSFLAFRIACLSYVTQNVANRLLVAGLKINIVIPTVANHTIYPKADFHTPLSMACAHGKESIVKEFLYFGANIFMERVQLRLYCSTAMNILIERVTAIMERVLLRESHFMALFIDCTQHEQKHKDGSNHYYFPNVIYPIIISYYDVYPEVFPALTDEGKRIIVEKCREETEQLNSSKPK